MTSLVVVMNNKGAAVAADSAMTITDGLGNTRTRNGVRKLFQISDVTPLSLMIYGSAEIMDMAWGPIIVNYRRQHGRTSFNTVEEASAHFLDYLDNYDQIFSEDTQAKHYLHYVAVIYNWIRDNVNHIVKQQKDDPSPDGPKTMRDVLRLAVDVVYRDVTQYPDDKDRQTLDGFGQDFGPDLVRRYGGDIEHVTEEFFGEVDMDRQTRARLKDIAHLAVTKDFFPDFYPHTGLVFTGYGANQITPQMTAYMVGIAVGGKLRRRLSSNKTIGGEDPVVIAPFAQQAMIHTFLTGMDEELYTYLVDQIVDLTIGVRDRTIAQLPQLNRDQRRKFAESYSDEEILELIHSFLDRLDAYQYQVHTHPILLAVESLPEIEMAHTAETLVSLNAFQQKVGMTPETVGGDIDVALLTNERFLWIRDSKA